MPQLRSWNAALSRPLHQQDGQVGGEKEEYPFHNRLHAPGSRSWPGGIRPAVFDLSREMGSIAANIKTLHGLVRFNNPSDKPGTLGCSRCTAVISGGLDERELSVRTSLIEALSLLACLGLWVAPGLLPAQTPSSASSDLRDQPFFMKPPYLLLRRASSKPLMVLFETRDCSDCNDLHRDAFARPEIRELLPRFDVARLRLRDPMPIELPDGRRLRTEAWARQLKITYTPTLLFFVAGGKEVLRIDAPATPFHLASALEYVAGGAYRKEPQFARFLKARADRMRARGEPVEHAK
jgi:thioredoxin-related protein